MLRIGVDTGGTFTDFIAADGSRQLSFKIQSTPRAPEEAILRGILRILDELGPAGGGGGGGEDRVRIEIVHGTTVATNALIERKGARTALVTTAGFEDVIEIGRQARPDLYNLSVTRPDPLVPSVLRFGLKERIAAEGDVVERLGVVDLEALVRRLRLARVESVAVSLLFSFANPEHEQMVAAALEPLNIPISVSHRILPEYREYERTSTVVINAYLAPLVSRYLSRLTAGLRELIPSGGKQSSTGLLVMQSSGGAVSSEVAAREPVRTILSGPAGGVVAAMRIASMAGLDEIITFDMGGTSTDVALCRGETHTTNEAQITGLPVAVPVLDIHTVGAGGGSIAWVDDGGALRVGPESAGADPGPACYGKGDRPTVTDANLVLGRFAGAGLLSGEMTLDQDRAAAAIDRLAESMSATSSKKVSREKAALGVIDVANANMERALRLVSVERGHDPRLFSLVSFGGAGGLHAAALAEALRVPRVLIPSYPGAFSALGVLLSDVIKDYSRTVMLAVDQGGPVPPLISGLFSELEAQAVADLQAEGFDQKEKIGRSSIRTLRSLAMRYRGQSYELDIPLKGDGSGFVRDFHQAHRERYGHADPMRQVEIVSLRLRGIGITGKPAIDSVRTLRRHKAVSNSRAAAWLGESKSKVTVYQRSVLKPGAQLDVPAIVVEYGSTSLIPNGWSCGVDRWRNLVLDRLGAAKV